MSTDIWLFEEPPRRLSQIERRSCQLQRELEHWLFLPTLSMSWLSKKGARSVGWKRSSARSAVAREARFFVELQYNSNSLFMCQDEDENEDEHQSFGSFWNLCMTNEPILQYIIVLRAWFVRHRPNPQRTKTFVCGFVFVFVLAHEQPIRLN